MTIPSTDRNPLLLVTAVLLVATMACTASADEVDDLAIEPAALTTTVAVTGGTIEGRSVEGLFVWEGIPYAVPPVDELRWRPPQPVDRWEGVLETKAAGPACAQLPGPEGGFYTEDLGATDEDCLTLNVWSRAEHAAERRPVMVWVHGGGLVTGTGSTYPGDVLTAKGVVLVTLNYRLGPFGFFAHPELSAESEHGVSGNQGFADQIAALEWVRDNIASFGGDPGNVTIFGESAGALSVSVLQATPLADGLFHRVIGQSGGAFHPLRERAQGFAGSPSAESIGVELAAVIAGAEAGLAKLRASSTGEVLQAAQAYNAYEQLPIVDGRVIPRQVSEIFAEGEQADVPTLVGSNADEGTTLVGYFQPVFGTGVDGFRAYAAATLPEASDGIDEAYPVSDASLADRAFADLFADVFFTYPQRAWARGMESVSSPAWLYWFTWAPPVPDSDYGAFHAADVAYVFGQLDVFGARPAEADRMFADRISDLWVRFAETGDPNGEGVPEWPAYTAENDTAMELGATIEVRSGVRAEQIELIDRAFRIRRGDAAVGGSDG